MITLQGLRCFVAVAETFNFTRAAEQMGVTQPALSEQIAHLERTLKGRLFDRLPRKVMLTAAGNKLLPQARALLAIVEAIPASLEEQADEPSGNISIAATATLAPFIVASAVSRFARQFPKIEVSLDERSASEILERIKDGGCDVGIIGIAAHDAQVLMEPLFSESLVVALRKKHPLVRKSEVSFEDLAGETLILIDELRDLAAPLVVNPSEARHPSIIGTGLQLATIESLVDSGAGVCLLPAMARSSIKVGGIVYRPIRGRAPVRTVYAVWHRDRVRPRGAQLFMEILRRVISESF